MTATGDTAAAGCEPIGFDALAGWAGDDHRAAFRAFLKSAERLAAEVPKTRGHGVPGEALARVAAVARGVPEGDARRFFERHFRPMRVSAPGFVTAYYEPDVAASPVQTAAFRTPLYRRPPDLVDIDDTNRPAGWDPDIRFGRLLGSGLAPYPDRAAIEGGLLAGQGLEIAWVADPVTAYFIHIQGSARLHLSDGAVRRIAYAGKSGHAYTSIGRLAVERGLLPADGADKTALERWLRADPERGRALMQENRSYIFFRQVIGQGPGDGPAGAAGVNLSAGRSLAVDRRWITFHTPVWVDAGPLAAPDNAGNRPFRRLMVAHDTGSAIVGPARGDLFFGTGDAAGDLAGRVRAAATMTLLVPRRAGEVS